MFLSNASTKRPIAMTCCIIVLLLLGVVSYRNLGLDFFPDVQVPYVTVTVVYPGASPEEIEVDVAKRLEDAVGTLDGLKEMNTSCMENICQIMLEFQLDQNVDIAAMDVREKIDMVKEDLPAGAEAPKILKFDPNASPVITLALQGDESLDQLFDYADEKLTQKISSLPGVAEVKISGGEELELEINVNSAKLSSTGLTMNDIMQTLSMQNIKLPVGRIQDGSSEFNITYDAEFKTIKDLGELEISNTPGKRIYLRDIATIKMQSSEKRSLAFYNGTPAIMLKVIKKGDANAVKVINQVRQVVDEINAKHQLPGGMKLIWVNDSGAFIQASVDDAWSSIIVGIILTAVILFVFLHEVKSTFIVVISMPMSIVISFWAMSLFGYTLNTFTLLALGTSVGTLVANSIVVVENIFNKLAEGMSPREAASVGTSEVAIPVFASAMTNVVVFVPIAMMSSLVGRFLAPFAVTITIATLASLLISFTMTPILAMILLKKDMTTKSKILNASFKYWDRFYGSIARKFDDSIDWVRKNPILPVLLSVALLILTFTSIQPRVGSTFTPDDDRGELAIQLEFPTYYNLNATTKTTLEIADKVRSLPNVLKTATVIGKIQGSIGRSSEGVYLAEISVILVPKVDKERTATLEEIRDTLRKELANVPNCVVSINIPSSTGSASAAMDLKIIGDNLTTLDRLATEGVAKLRVNEKARDIDNNVRVGKPEIKVIPKRSIVRNLDLSSNNIATMLRSSVEGIKTSTYKQGARSYDIRVISNEKNNIRDFNQLTFANKNGSPLNIEVISDLKHGSIPIQINRSDRQRVTKVFANPAAGVGLGDLVKETEAIISPLLPDSYRLEFGGMVKTMNESAKDFMQAIILAVILTYLLIAAILESWTQPFLIMFTVPLSLIGMYLALFIAGIPMSIFGNLGFVMLIGIVVNNAILIMDDLVINLRKNIDPNDAMQLAVKNKFRPILMTSIAAILGILPMALGNGLGSESRASCGIAVVGGLISSTILSLYVIPAVYIWFHRAKKKKKENIENV